MKTLNQATSGSPLRKSLLSLALVCAAFSYSHASLVAYWAIEEGSGTTTTESVSSTASDTFGSGVFWSTDTPGPASTASISLAGTSGIGTNLDSADVGIAGSGAKTIISWIKTGSASEGAFFGYSPTVGSTAGADLRFLVNSAGQLRFEANVGNFAISSATVNDNAWHMVALVIPANATTSGISFYVDGTLAGPVSSGGSTILDTATGGEFIIGSDGNAGRHFSGLIDDVRIYDTALTKAELDAIFTAIPEPSAALFAGLGLLALLRRRR